MTYISQSSDFESFFEDYLMDIILEDNKSGHVGHCDQYLKAI